MAAAGSTVAGAVGGCAFITRRPARPNGNPKSADSFYNVAFHELTHWTGHKSRLDRDLKHRFGERAYAAEELTAELGAAFLAAEFSFDGDVRNAGYIATWIDLLKADKRATSPRATGLPRPRNTFAAWRLPTPRE